MPKLWASSVALLVFSDLRHSLILMQLVSVPSGLYSLRSLRNSHRHSGSGSWESVLDITAGTIEVKQYTGPEPHNGVWYSDLPCLTGVRNCDLASRSCAFKAEQNQATPKYIQPFMGLGSFKNLLRSREKHPLTKITTWDRGMCR